MRLFVAVNFDERFRLNTAKLIGELQKNSERGNFSRIQNLHITLQFIGETNDMQKAAEAVSNVDFLSFPIDFNRISGFKRQGTEICWLGVSEDGELKKLSEAVGRELAVRGFRLESKPFVAHLTLGREVRFRDGFKPEEMPLQPDLKSIVSRISLMKSERIKGVLTYSEIMSKNASDPRG